MFNVFYVYLIMRSYIMKGYVVTPSTGAGGAITPSTAQTIGSGLTTTFTVTPNAGYTASVGGTCGGTLVGTTYTTNAITANCTVSATFALNTYTLTYTAGANGSITGTTPQTVNYGANGTAVTAVPATNYHFVNWSDASTANPRTDTGVTGNVTVTANFAINTYTVTPSAGSNGSISPATPKTINYGSTTTFTVTPNTGYTASVGGTCGGTLSGTNYTTYAVTADCSVSVSFTHNATTTGAFSFNTSDSYNVGTSPDATVTGDFNGDGKLDLAVANGGSGTVSILLGNGDGTFQTAVNYAAGTNPSGVTTGDFNGDGKLDLAVANGGSGTVSVLLGNGDGTFQTAVNYAAGTNPSGVSTGDFNGDGKLDLAVANGGSGTVSVLLGNGDGTFQTAVNYAAGTNPSGVTTGDFNGDGKLDLAVANGGSGTVSVLLGNGDGTFQTAVNYAAGTNPSGVSTGDFNGDGKLDLAVTNQGSNEVSILTGNGDGTFGAAANFTVAGGPLSVTVGDFNIDGRPDLAVTNYNSSNVSILVNVAQYIVTPSAGAGGTISPSTAQAIASGLATAFTVTAYTGYHIASVGGTCGGALSGTTYTTNAITADCTVTALFASTYTAPTTYTVTPYAGAGGSISPATPQTISSGSRAYFTVTPATGYSISSVTGCGGALAGNTFTTAAITGNCTVSAAFKNLTYQVTPSAGANGSISPSTPQTINYGLTTTFTVTPDVGYTASVGGTCGGNLSGTIYTTNGITSDCTVDAIFTPKAAQNVCTYIITPESQSFDSSGGNATVSVAKSSIACVWLAGSNASWITITAGSIGEDNSTVNFKVASNSGAPRTGTLTIAGHTFTVAQAGIQHTLTLTKSGIGLGKGLINDSGSELLCGADCQVAALKYDTGTTVTLSATPEAGAIFTGWSGGGCAGTGECKVTLISDTSVNAVFSTSTAPATDISTTTLVTTGNEVYINVPLIKDMTNNRAEAPVYYNDEFLFVPTTDNKIWLKLTKTEKLTDLSLYNGYEPSALYYSGSDLMLHLNNITINGAYIWADLKNVQRNDGDTWFVITEYGSNILDSCTYSLTPTSQAIDFTGGAGSVSMTSSSSGCIWTAASNAAWLTLTSESSGTGNSTFTFTAEANTGTARTGTLTIAGQTFTVTQAGIQHTLTLTKSGTGTGKGLIYNSGSELLCGADCELAVLKYEAGTTLTLSAVAESGSTFKGWNGEACPSTGACTLTITLNGDTSINAVFSAAAAPVSDLSTSTLLINGNAVYINVPIIKYINNTDSTAAYYSAEFVYVLTDDNKVWFKLTMADVVTDITPYLGTQMSQLYFAGSDLMLHLDNITINGIYAWADLKYMPTNDGKLWFVVTVAGTN